MTNFVVAIPSYNRENIITTKTLKTLKEGGISPKKIYIFVPWCHISKTIYETNLIIFCSWSAELMQVSVLPIQILGTTRVESESIP